MNAFQKSLISREFAEQMADKKPVVFDERPELQQPAVWVITGERRSTGEDRFFVGPVQINEAMPTNELAAELGGILEEQGGFVGHAINPLTGVTMYLGSSIEQVATYAKAREARKA